MAITYNVFCDPSPASFQTLRTDDTTGNNVGTVFGGCSAILGGIPAAVPTNVNCADLSVILMGDSNTINIFSAGPPVVPGTYNIIGNGTNNVVAGTYNVIVDGDTNNIFGDFNFVGTGQNNNINGAVAAIVGGSRNTLNSQHSFIGAGELNLVGGNHSAIVAGATNCINNGSISSFIGGGEGHIIASPIAGLGAVHRSFIGGGQSNCIDAGNGVDNCFNVIGGGFTNCITHGDFNFVGSGNNNRMTSIAVAGSQAINYSFIGGGNGNQIASSPTLGSSNNFIGGGSQNLVRENSNFSSILGGMQNTLSAVCSTIGGGFNNCIGGVTPGTDQSINNFIGGGESNQIDANNILYSMYNVIDGGQCNYIGVKVSFGSITTGWSNCISESISSIVGGSRNTIDAQHAFIGAGELNLIGGNHSAIVAGATNCIITGSISSFIGGGEGNTIASSVAGSGSAHRSFIGGGQFNCIDTSDGVNICFNVIGGGFSNRTLPSATRNFIGSGDSNITGGESNSVTGGLGNAIAASAMHSHIGGGHGNTVSGKCSAILGGQNSTDSGQPLTGIFGSGIVATPIPGGLGAFWANELVIPNIPLSAGPPPPGYPLGALYYKIVGGAKQVFVV